VARVLRPAWRSVALGVFAPALDPRSLGSGGDSGLLLLGRGPLRAGLRSDELL